MNGNPNLLPPAAGDDVRDLWHIVAELVEMHNRPWECKPDGIGKFVGSQKKVVLDMGGVHQFIVIENGAAFFYNIPAIFVGAV